ncbi:MAG TPA: hypothetical protein VD837_03440 [Terriglobales bacterium]|nr:hypothetical protein [Terriglobales bacterium]
MYCNSCGSPVTCEQAVCPKCGSSIIGVRAAVKARTRVAEHAHLLAIFWFVVAFFWVIPAFVMFALAGIVSGPIPNLEGPARVAAPFLFGALAIGFVLATLISFVTGWGLLKLRPWGRTLALVMAFLAIIHPPFGTALGIYTLFVLLPDAAGDEYRRMSAAASADEGRAATV